MDITSLGIIALCVACIVARPWAAISVAINSQYYALALWLVLTACHSTYVLCLGMAYGREAVAADWTGHGALWMVPLVIVSLECFWSMAQHFPRPNVLGSALLIAFGGGSLMAVASTGEVFVRALPTALTQAFDWQRHFSMGCLLFLFASFLSFWALENGIKMRLNAKRYAVGLMLILFSQTVRAEMMRAYGTEDYTINACASIGAYLFLLAGCWMFRLMDFDGNVADPPHRGRYWESKRETDAWMRHVRELGKRTGRGD